MLAADVGFIDSATMDEISNCEEQIKRRIPRGDSVSVQNIESELLAAGRSDFSIRKAIDALARRGEVKYASQRKFLMRER